MARFVLKILTVVVLTVHILSCARAAQGEKDIKKEQQPSHFNHVVRYEGETLSIIAEWYTGSTDNWKVLAKENPNIKPNLIKIGDVIRIPQALLVKTEPLPKSKLARKQARQSQQKPRSKADEIGSLEQSKKDDSKSTTNDAQTASKINQPNNAPSVSQQNNEQDGGKEGSVFEKDEERERIRRELLKELLQ
ncbi:MAG: LysM peptidoglycan-binding domain-containing protein [Deltaproteobacteria bacterium]|nr:LysM peptidoglycan-binding domain-containing protein [Deltaproteobacteria bacterium]